MSNAEPKRRTLATWRRETTPYGLVMLIRELVGMVFAAMRQTPGRTDRDLGPHSQKLIGQEDVS